MEKQKKNLSDFSDVRLFKQTDEPAIRDQQFLNIFKPNVQTNLLRLCTHHTSVLFLLFKNSV